MVKKNIILCLLSFLLFASCSDGEINVAPDADYGLSLAFTGPATRVVYVAWLEDANGDCLQNLYVCNSVVGIGSISLTGTALPYWQREKYTLNSNVDSVTGASVQSENTMNADVLVNASVPFRVCFEIDKSLNSNDYFGDRPAYTYKSDLIDLNALEASYPLSLKGWMANETLSGTYSQAPSDSTAVTGFDSFSFNTNLNYISPNDDLVTTLTATVTAY